MDNKEFAAVQNKKKPYKFNITDVFLILIIVIAAAVLIYIVAGTNLFFGGEEVTVQYKIEIPLLRNEFVPEINKIGRGDKITDSVRGYDIGEIHHVSVDRAMEYTEDSERGIVKLVPYPDYSKVVITVRAKARIDEPNYYVNGRVIMKGIMMYFRTQHFTGYGQCVEFIVITED